MKEINCDRTYRVRVGGPAPSSLWTSTAECLAGFYDPAQQDFGSMKDMIAKELARRDIPCKDLKLVDQRDTVISDSKRHVILCITTGSQDPEDVNHRRSAAMDALEAILSSLKANKTPIMQIEIRDDEISSLAFSAASMQDSHLGKVWDQVRIKCLQILEEEFQGQWRTLTVMNYGHRSDRKQATIVIGIKNSCPEFQHEDIQTSIYEAMQVFGPDVARTTNVALCRASMPYGSDNEGRTRVSQPQGFEESSDNHATPHVALDILHTADSLDEDNGDFGARTPMYPLPELAVGSSIGVGASTGTLGMFVKVEWRGQIYDMILTNDHVIRRPDDLLDNPEPGPISPRLDRTEHIVSSPSDRDNASEIQLTEDLIKDSYRALKGDMARGELGLELKLQCLSPESDEDERLLIQARIEEAQNSITQHSQMIDQLRRTNRALGRVFASSGLNRLYDPVRSIPSSAGSQTILKSGAAVNWALVHIESDRAAQNLLPGVTSGYLEYASTVQYPEEGIPNGTIVFYRGRTSGMGLGRINGYKIDIRVGTKMFLQEADVLVNDGRYSIGLGDSGTGLFRPGAVAVGLCFSGNSGRNEVYCIPLARVYADVYNLTGARIVYPPLRRDC